MGHLHHANAKTTARIREEIQNSNATILALAAHYHLNPKTILKWKHAGRTTDKKSGPTSPKSTVLTTMEEQIICEFRRQTQLSLDDVFISLKDKIPNLTRSNLHRCLVRHGLNRLPKDENAPAKSKKKFKNYDIGYMHADITELRLENKKMYLFVGICRVCKYVYVELHDRMTVNISVAFLENLIADCPFKIHTILTDNGIQFTYKLLARHQQPKNKIHPFDALCKKHEIEHRLTKFRHPWTNGQVEIMNKKIKAHTTRKYHYVTVKQLKQHLMAYVLVYNFQQPLKALHYKSPYETIIEIFEKNPTLFKDNPHHKTVGLNR